MELHPVKHTATLSPLLGQRRGLLTIVAIAGSKHFRRGVAVVYRCRCDCGTEVLRDRQTLIRQVASSSCGCSRRVNQKGTHAPGETAHPLHKTWRHMIDRCTNPANKSFVNYGGRGIRVCERWLDGDGKRSGLGCFAADMGDKPAGLTLERVDNDREYSPTNCTWADWKTQSRNRRFNRVVEFGGVSKPISAWAEEYGLPYFTLMARIKRHGWPVERALKTPVRPLTRRNPESTAPPPIPGASTGPT